MTMVGKFRKDRVVDPFQMAEFHGCVGITLRSK